MNVTIIGGTSGLGLALAKHYLAAGHDVLVCGRDTAKIPAKYALLRTADLDIADKSAMSAMFNQFVGQLDLLIVAAGFYFNHRHHELDRATTLRMLQTNVSGLNHAFEIAAEKMMAQQSGHLVAISSVAGLLKNYPGASLYSATKRSVINVCDTYRIALAPFSIKVTAIVPGYIDTEKLRQLNDGDASRKPFLMSEEKAVTHIVKAIDSSTPIVIFPWQLRWLVRLLNVLPKSLLARRP
jgi:short-subunit dehydrogenase